MTTQNLMCPVCRQRLELVSKTWRCEQGHSYDIAKQGYVNLHVVQHKHSKNPGDTPESVDARRAFLQGGYYQPLQQAVVHLLKDLKAKMVLDIGCGEGYYTSAMQQVVEQCIGVDIAKNAVQRAAKLNDKVTWVVGTGATLPVIDQSLDVCTSLFSPIPQMEILRVLKDDGYLIVVTPATDHLYAMREALFEQVNPHTPQKFVEQLQDLFELKEQQVIDAPLVLDQQALKNLIAMTPYAYKASPERRMQLEQKAHLQVTASFQIYLFQKRNKKAI
ncbi:methyltransferase domain-containing protein [Acinetobacter baumannii]|uniref:23S rRNA (Guanine(745)-N(1))-methyltransferase n=2 Tax=Acinetobacter baumannii TaxID=470 RepID=A0A5K6CM88_ACIB3|nr:MULTISPECIES: methyltransferase domain-containing protein [Acinetobacter]ATY42783.1 23S rRNA (guanine(745)-N(1))-methyltransferase [Acinetobacter baumannii AB307-0294]EHU1265349.1 methyltransferase domain-containing protein [Acinetobacter baumannii]EHU1293426.1 methyltransferase domain-containing protein [Acinetobacter baumannii]EHU1349024.1 methyltransferase domain-containing protein [Acinetobacter baumannii]EHU1445035.1 methyltransferase domain-containing protein [Acinetobacter baumannii]